MQETFLHQNMEIFWKYITSKGKATLGTSLDFAHFSGYLQTKKTVWKQGDAIFSEPEMLWSSFGEF